MTLHKGAKRVGNTGAGPRSQLISDFLCQQETQMTLQKELLFW